MSRPRPDDGGARRRGRPVADGDALRTLVATLAERAAARGERALLVAEAVPPSPPTAEGTGESRDTRPATPDRTDRLAARLGTERTRLLHDARAGIDPALLAAEAGTVVAGGVLALLVSGSAPPSRFAARLDRLIDACPDDMPGTVARVVVPDAATLAAAMTPRHGGASSPATIDAAALSAQDALLERICVELARGPDALVLVEAPRGRGKSALLGRLAARLERAGTGHAVCAAHRASLQTLERHRCLALASSPVSPLPFLAPDAALARGGDTLLIDEAASLPLPLVEALLGRWRRIVLATTVEGHESAGRAFALRLPAILDRERPGWLGLSATAPMRWRAGDPLETLLRRALMLDTDGVPLVRRRARLAEPIDCPARPLDRDALAADEDRLRELFGLLVATHYQSTPLDLAHLLDAPGLRLWAIERDGGALAVALVAIEPGIEPALHADVLARRRRPPHRLLPQLLAQGANRGDALAANVARVLRVAVRPEARRRGLGRRLVAAIVRDLGDEVEAVGASFGETPATLAFWRACGFTPFHRGARRNPRSGRRSVAVLRATSPRTRAVLATAAAVHRDNAAAADAFASPGKDTTAPPAADDFPDDAPGARMPDERLLESFVANGRSLADTLGALRRLLVRETSGTAHPPAPPPPAATDDPAAALLHALGRRVPPARRAREASVRAWVARTLERA